MRDMEVDPRFRAFLEGFEAEHIDIFLAKATVGDARALGKLSIDLVKIAVEKADKYDAIRSALDSLQATLK